MSNYDELLKQREQLDRQILELQQKEKLQAIEQVKSLIEKHHILVGDVFSKKLGVASLSKKVPVKYRNPTTGQTWTGRGKAPLWIAGLHRDDFLIK
jgi:DNA-binding protein H-NS